MQHNVPFFLLVYSRETFRFKRKKKPASVVRGKEALAPSPAPTQPAFCPCMLSPPPSHAKRVVLLGKQAWLLLFIACLFSLCFAFFCFSLCVFLAALSSSLFEQCKSFIVAVLLAKSLWRLKWHLKPFEIQPSPLPPPPILEVKWNKMAGPNPAVSLRDCRASFWGLGGSDG